MRKKNLYLISIILLFLIIYKTNFLRSLHDLLIVSYDDRISNIMVFVTERVLFILILLKKILILKVK